MIIKKAKYGEAQKILEFYQNVIRFIRGTEFVPKWNEKYPNLEYIQNCISKGELYICTDENEIVSSFILNHEFDNDYSSVKWKTDSHDMEVTVIHTFAIGPSYRSKGLSSEIFEKIKKIALSNNQKTLRIDIVGGNVGAQRVFEKLGFEFITTVEIEHYAVGLQDFHLYEFGL